MCKAITFATLVLIVVTSALSAEGGEMTKGLHWLGHDAFRIAGPPVVYIDPYQLKDGLPPADLILVTHAHGDHLSPADIARIRGPKTVIAGPQEVADKLPGVTVLAVGETKRLQGAEVRAVPAYNTDRRFHPKGAGKQGFVLTVAGVTYYHAGDTDLIPEMDGLAPDVALLPVSGTYVMTADEAAVAARRIGPKVAVPMHHGSVVGTDADARRFAKLLEGSGIEVVVLAKE